MSSENGDGPYDPSRRKFLRSLALGGALGATSLAVSQSLIPSARAATSTVDAESYIIYNDAGTIKARNGTTGVIDYSGPNAQQVIQNTMDLGLPNGGLIALRRATYDLPSTLTIRKGIALVGEWSDSAFPEVVTLPVTKLRWTGAAGGTMIQTNSGSAWTGALRNLVIDGNSGALKCLVLSSPYGGHFENLNIRGAADQGPTKAQTVYVTTLSSSVNAVFNVFSRVLVHDTQGIGLEMSGNGAPVTLNSFVNCRFSAVYISLRLTQWADTNYYFGGRVEAKTFGILLNDTATPSQDAQVYQNFFYGLAVDADGPNVQGVRANKNLVPNYFLNCPFGENPGASWASKVSLNNSALIKFFDCPGWNLQGVTAITVQASPFTYTNNDGFPEAIYIRGGTVTNISKNAQTIFSNSPATVWLEPGESVLVSYTSPPVMMKDRK